MTAPMRRISSAVKADQGKRRYPTQAAIDRAIRAARKAGLKVTGFEITPSGVIRILDDQSAASARSEAEEWV